MPAEPWSPLATPRPHPRVRAARPGPATDIAGSRVVEVALRLETSHSTPTRRPAGHRRRLETGSP